MKYRYSGETNSFYPWALFDDYKRANAWPENGVDVDEDIFTEYSGTPPEGKTRGPDVNGKPTWIDVQPPSKKEQIIAADFQKSALLAEATAIIAPLADAQTGGYIDDVDVPRLAEWQRYRYKLTKVDTSTAPDVIWPELPEA